MTDKYTILNGYLKSLEKIPLISDDALHNDALLYVINKIRKKIKRLEQFDQEKIVVLTESDLIGWDNIGEVIERKTR